MEQMTFSVTLVRIASGCPVFDIGAYRYEGPWLPSVGDVISITRAPDAEGDGPHALNGYVTRVDGAAETPIRVTEHSAGVLSADDYIVAT